MFPNGGCEAFVELQKALNVVGDYRLSSSVTSARWATPFTAIAPLISDYQYDIASYDVNGAVTATAVQSTAGVLSYTIGSACYCAAIDLETSNGVEISGLNAEEQSDISFIATWTINNGAGATQVAGNILTVFTYYDAMLILRENNVLELIQ